MRKSRLTRLLAGVLAIGLAASACGDDKSSSSSTTAASGASTTVAPATTAAPVKGGTITVGQYSRENGLDPTKLNGGGTVGGSELAALYDTLMRYNPETGKYEPQLAESLLPNADYTEWTLKLRPNIKFPDGTALDSAAVDAVLERQLKDGSAAPKGQYTSQVDSKTVVDALSIKFKLKKGWVGFPYLFTGPWGLIYNINSFKKAADANAFNINPGSDAGVGPFRLKSYKPKELIEFERNPGYWRGADNVYLDGLKFVFIGDPQATYDAVKTGTLQFGFVRDTGPFNDAVKNKFYTVYMPSPQGSIINMNAGPEITCAANSTVPACAGQAAGAKVKVKTPTSDLNVRKAVQAAIDPKVVNERAYNGLAKADSAPYANLPLFDPKVPGPAYDVTAAKNYLAAAKAATGYDGKIRLMAANDPIAQRWVQAVKTLLELAGFTVDLKNDIDTAGLVNKVIAEADYDLTAWAYGQTDDTDGNYIGLVGTFTARRYGYGNADMDAAVDLLRLADTDQKRIDAYKKISEVWNRDAPAAVIATVDGGFVGTPKLSGVYRNGYQIVMYDKAWLAK
jgi:peptide/nickel transport system substrate-binding protein